MNKKIHLAILAAAVSFSICGCSLSKKTPTPEELLENPFGDDVKNVSASYNVTADGSISMNAFLGSSTDEKTTTENQNTNDASSDSTGSMDVSAGLEGTCYYSDSLSYTEGSVNYSFGGISGNEPYKVYMVTNEGSRVTYTYDNDDAVWEKKDYDADTGKAIKSLNKDVFESLSEVEVDKKSDDAYYKITGTVNAKKIKEIASESDDSINETDSSAGSSVADMSENVLSDSDLEKIKLDVDMSFNKNKQIKNICVSISPDNKIESMKINDFSISVTIDQINGDAISIPDEVVSSATDAGDTEISTEENTTEGKDITVSDSNSTETPDISAKNPEESNAKKETTEVETSENSNDTDIYEVTDTNEDTLAMLVFGVDSVTNSDISSAISAAGLNIPSDDVLSAMTNLLNSYTVSKLTANLTSYNMWNDSNKMAIVYFYGLGVFSLDDLVSYGINADEITTKYTELILQE
jgi:lipoprotein